VQLSSSYGVCLTAASSASHFSLSTGLTARPMQATEQGLCMTTIISIAFVVGSGRWRIALVKLKESEELSLGPTSKGTIRPLAERHKTFLKNKRRVYRICGLFSLSIN
jgi:hypothetical protein